MTRDPDVLSAKLRLGAEAGRPREIAVLALVVWTVAARGPAGPESFFLMRPREVPK